jgi:hypothetical protein
LSTFSDPVGIEDGFSKESKNVFFKQVAKVKDSAIHWNYKGLTYKIFISKEDKVFLWNPHKYDSYTQLYFRCPSSTQFPLDIFETLTADRKEGKGETLTISFKANANKEVFAKTTFSSSAVPNTTSQGGVNANQSTSSASTSLSAFVSTVEVLCRRLLIIHSSEKEEDRTQTHTPQWILYIHSELAFFAFGNANLDFGASLKKPLTVGAKS